MGRGKKKIFTGEHSVRGESFFGEGQKIFFLGGIIFWGGVKNNFLGGESFLGRGKKKFLPGNIVLGCEIYNHLMEDILTP